jgi:protein associated with RNAse G/E
MIPLIRLNLSSLTSIKDNEPSRVYSPKDYVFNINTMVTKDVTSVYYSKQANYVCLSVVCSKSDQLSILFSCFRRLRW